MRKLQNLEKKFANILSKRGSIHANRLDSYNLNWSGMIVVIIMNFLLISSLMNSYNTTKEINQLCRPKPFARMKKNLPIAHHLGRFFRMKLELNRKRYPLKHIILFRCIDYLFDWICSIRMIFHLNCIIYIWTLNNIRANKAECSNKSFLCSKKKFDVWML